MEINVIGQEGVLSRPLAGIVGVWDPTLHHHRVLFRYLAASARERGFESVVITLDPAPASLALGQCAWVTHSDLAWRQEVQRQCGIERLVVVCLKPEEADGSARFFLEKLSHELPLKELWLGARQTFGRFHASSREAIEASCSNLGISVSVLEDIVTEPPKGTFRKLLEAGRVAEACRVAGVPPVWRKPHDDVLRLSWPAGIYTVIFCASIARCVEAVSSWQATPSSLQVELQRNNSSSWMTWPCAEAEWLVFVRGPGDELPS